MATLTIVRGLPGSGKSTYAKTLGVFHVEADMYFYRDGEYQYNPKTVWLAHKWCYDRVRRELEKGIDVVVSNTFTTLREMKKYLELGEELGIEIVIKNCRGEYGSIHGVPEETMEKMRKRWLEVPDGIYVATD